MIPKIKAWHCQCPAQLLKLPGTPQDPPHALPHVFHHPQSSRAWIWSCSTFLGCTERVELLSLSLQCSHLSPIQQ